MVAASWKVRREGYRRLGHHKRRRARDRVDREGLPNMKREHGRYGSRVRRYAKLVARPQYVASRFLSEVRPEVTETAFKRIDKSMAQTRAGISNLPIVKSESAYTRELKLYIERRIELITQWVEEHLVQILHTGAPNTPEMLQLAQDALEEATIWDVDKMMKATKNDYIKFLKGLNTRKAMDSYGR